MQEDKRLENYEDILINTDRTSVMMVCINGHNGDVPYGDIVSCHLTKFICFKGLHELIFAIDEACEQVGAPMQTTEPRFLNIENEERYKKLFKKKKQMSPLEKNRRLSVLFPLLSMRRR